MPVRIQRKRTKGWKMPEGAVVCTRPGRWGNAYTVKECGSRQSAVTCFRVSRSTMPSEREAIRRELRGKDLVCWCHLCPRHQSGKPWNQSCADCDPCHVDILLEIANAPIKTTEEAKL